jgi:hypothetical protein
MCGIISTTGSQPGPGVACSDLGSGIAESVMVGCEWCGAGGGASHGDLGRWIGRLAAVNRKYILANMDGGLVLVLGFEDSYVCSSMFRSKMLIEYGDISMQV